MGDEPVEILSVHGSHGERTRPRPAAPRRKTGDTSQRLLIKVRRPTERRLACGFLRLALDEGVPIPAWQRAGDPREWDAERRSATTWYSRRTSASE